MSKRDPDVVKAQKLVDKALGKHKYTYPTQLNAQKPKPPFASVKKLAEINPGIDRVRIEEKDDGIIQYTEGVRLIDMEVLFTEGAEEQSMFAASFKRDDILDFMRKEDFAVLNHEPITNNTLKLETNWEIRDGLRITCMVRRSYAHPISQVDTAEVNGVYNEADTEIEIAAVSSNIN